MDGERKTIIVCGFPGVGKTLAASWAAGVVIDCDSSRFHYTSEGEERVGWVKQYVDQIESLAKKGEYTVVLTSTHAQVLNELDNRGLDYIIVLPRRDCKDEYLGRYLKRGSDFDFVEDRFWTWDTFLDQLEERAVPQIHLGPGQYIADILPKRRYFRS